MSEKKYAVAYSLVPGIGRARVARLEAHFGSLERAWHADSAQLSAAGLDQRAVRSLAARRSQLDLDAELGKLERLGVQVITWHDDQYPVRLREIHDRPFVIYVRGQLLPEDEWAVAVVGTRKSTAYGRQATEHIVGHLAAAGITIVSGLALGIDAVAHKAAIDTGGRTIAVTATGQDIVYPSTHRQLARAVADSGAVVTEQPLGALPDRRFFPIRNRLMSGLSLGVLVVEGDLASGARITANWALEQNREVFCIPGSIFSKASALPNKLISEGAKLVRSADDVLEELNLSMVAQRKETTTTLPQDETEERLLKYLSHDPVHVDVIIRSSGLPSSTVGSTLAIMELKGLVKQVGGMSYVLGHEVPERYGARAP